MRKAILALILAVPLVTGGCAFSITGEGLFLVAGDSSVVTEESTVTGGSISESMTSLIEGLAALIPFGNPPAPDITIVVPGEESD